MKSNKYALIKTNHRGNNFDLLRLIAAFFVLVSHSFGILNKGLEQPGVWINGVFIIPSDIGLFIFFTISGYLVTQSFFNSSSWAHYLWKRFLRIVPALVVVNIACIVMGGFMSSSPVKEYYSDKSVWTYLFTNSTLVANQYSLPGVFTMLQNKSINSSLWTILVEVRFYIVLMIAGVLSILSRKWLVLACFIFFEALRVYININNIEIKGIYTDVYFTYGTYFFLGSVFYCFKDAFSFKWFYAIILLVIALFTTNTSIQSITQACFLSYTILITGKSKAIINIKGYDFSYGLYLYAFPVQQVLLLYFGTSINPWLHVLLSTFMSLVFAALSWFFIERPALNQKDVFITKQLCQ